MNPYDVLVKPLLSEKSNSVRETQNKYSFMIAVKATKEDVKKAVQLLYNVKVVSVTTLINRGKVKRRGNNVAQMPKAKKAVVTLGEGVKIPLFEDL